jgi:hypothetical protein
MLIPVYFPRKAPQNLGLVVYLCLNKICPDYEGKVFLLHAVYAVGIGDWREYYFKGYREEYWEFIGGYQKGRADKGIFSSVSNERVIWVKLHRYQCG